MVLKDRLPNKEYASLECRMYYYIVNKLTIHLAIYY